MTGERGASSELSGRSERARSLTAATPVWVSYMCWRAGLGCRGIKENLKHLWAWPLAGPSFLHLLGMSQTHLQKCSEAHSLPREAEPVSQGLPGSQLPPHTHTQPLPLISPSLQGPPAPDKTAIICPLTPQNLEPDRLTSNALCTPAASHSLVLSYFTTN